MQPSMEVGDIFASGHYLTATDERLKAINNRAKLIHRDIRSKLKLVDKKWNGYDNNIGPCETHLSTYGKVRELAIGSFSEWRDDIETLVRVCACRIAHFKTFCFKRLAILSLGEIAVLLRNRANQIGIGDKETRKHNVKMNSTITGL